MEVLCYKLKMKYEFFIGLNLSRALGDHYYKTNKTLQLEDQMISPLPDIVTQEITSEDKFLVVACDGIW